MRAVTRADTGCMPSKFTLATAGAVLALAVLPSSAHATDVCNEAENSHRGGYTVNGGPVDPNPPAFLRGSRCASARATRASSTPRSTRRRCARAARRVRTAAAAEATRSSTCELDSGRMSAALRCVFYDPDILDPASRLNDLAFEACARADVQVYALAGDETAVEVGGELHDVAIEDGSVAFVMRALGLDGRAVHRRRGGPGGRARRHGVGEPAGPRDPRAPSCAWPRRKTTSSTRP